MKKKINILFATALCALATCASLVGCSSGSGGASASMVGYWELTGGASGGEEITENMVKAMADEDLRCILHLGEDGKATLDLFGDVEDGTWDADKSTAKFGDDKVTLKLSGDSLTASGEDDESLAFKKGKDSLAKKVKEDRKAMKEADAGTDVETERVAIDPPVVIADDEVANITAVARVVDENGMGGIELTIDELKDINFTLTIYEVEHFNDLGVYEVNVP